MVAKIAITGPESTGKSTLAAQLATYYNTVHVPEYARTYIGNLQRPYTLPDLELIARKQVQLEKEYMPQANKLLICDTDLFVIKIWAEHAFGECPVWVLDALCEQNYTLHLLLNIDLPWQPDPQREHPHLREYLLQRYRRELTLAKVPFVEINGSGNTRLQNAVQAIEECLPELRSC